MQYSSFSSACSNSIRRRFSCSSPSKKKFFVQSAAVRVGLRCVTVFFCSMHPQLLLLPRCGTLSHVLGGHGFPPLPLCFKKYDYKNNKPKKLRKEKEFQQERRSARFIHRCKRSMMTMTRTTRPHRKVCKKERRGMRKNSQSRRFPRLAAILQHVRSITNSVDIYV
jgi:hypothetical protein